MLKSPSSRAFLPTTRLYKSAPLFCPNHSRNRKLSNQSLHFVKGPWASLPAACRKAGAHPKPRRLDQRLLRRERRGVRLIEREPPLRPPPRPPPPRRPLRRRFLPFGGNSVSSNCTVAPMLRARRSTVLRNRPGGYPPDACRSASADSRAKIIYCSRPLFKTPSCVDTDQARRQLTSSLTYLHVGSNWCILATEFGGEDTDPARETRNGSLGCFS